MANRQTGIGLLCRSDPLAARAEVRRVLFRNHGATKASARDLFIERRQMLRLIHRFGLWHFVWSLRRVALRRQLPDQLKHGLESE